MRSHANPWFRDPPQSKLDSDGSMVCDKVIEGCKHEEEDFDSPKKELLDYLTCELDTAKAVRDFDSWGEIEDGPFGSDQAWSTWVDQVAKLTKLLNFAEQLEDPHAERRKLETVRQSAVEIYWQRRNSGKVWPWGM